MFEVKGKYTTAKVYAEIIEEECIGQIVQMTNHPAFTQPIAIQPDAHYGKGSCVGFTMPLTDKVIPNVVGVDIGCGMTSCNIGKQENLDLPLIDKIIHEVVPMGHNVHWKAERSKDYIQSDQKLHKELQKDAEGVIEHYNIKSEVPAYNGKWLDSLIKKIGCRNYLQSIGTLGGGNHFIELGRSQNTQDLWLTIHSGSRNFGLRVCKYFQDLANKKHKNKIREDRREAIFALPPQQRENALKNLFHENIHTTGYEWLEGEDLLEYLFVMHYAQTYALINRLNMIEAVLDKLEISRDTEIINSTHNYIDFNDYIIRKGACGARLDEKFIVPLNMKEGILVCIGKGNPDWNYSAPHGAGRIMSRTQAKKTLSMDKFIKDMEKIYSSSVCQSTLDESPDSYKPSETIKKLLPQTGDIVDTIIPILNVKAKNETISRN